MQTIRRKQLTLIALVLLALAAMGADGKDAGCGPGPKEVVETCTPTSLTKYGAKTSELVGNWVFSGTTDRYLFTSDGRVERRWGGTTISGSFQLNDGDHVVTLTFANGEEDALGILFDGCQIQLEEWRELSTDEDGETRLFTKAQ